MKQYKVPWNIYDIFFVIFLELIIFLFLAPLVRSFIPDGEYLYSIYIFFVYILQSVISLGILYLFTIYKYKVKIKDFGFGKINIKKSIPFVLSMWLVALLTLTTLSIIINYLFGEEIPGFMPQTEHIPLFGNNPLGIISLIISAFIIAPIVEEIIFRGFILQGLLKFLSPLSSVLITSMLFAILHFEFSSIIPLFIIGTIIGFIYMKNRSIWECLLYHALNNGLAILIEFVLIIK